MIRGLLVFCMLTGSLGCSSLPGVGGGDGLTGTAGMEGRGAMGAIDQRADTMAGHKNVTRLEDERVSNSLIIIEDDDSYVTAAHGDDRGASNAKIVIEQEHTVFEEIYFDFDRQVPQKKMLTRLLTQAKWLRSHKGADVLVAGHCDAHGSREYNMVLGEKRAQWVKSFFMKSGVNGKRISIISYGKERLSCLNATQACHSTNRRAHIALQ